MLGSVIRVICPVKQNTKEATSNTATTDPDDSVSRSSGDVKPVDFNSEQDEITESDDHGQIEDDKVQNAKAMFLSFFVLFACTATTCIIVHLSISDLVTSCALSFWLQHIRLILVVSIVAWTPYVYIFTIPNMKKGVLGLLSKIRQHKVAPLQAEHPRVM